MDELVFPLISCLAFILSLGSFALGVYACIKVLAFERTEYKVIPVESGTSGLEKLEKELEKLQGNQNQIHDDLLQADIDPEDLV